MSTPPRPHRSHHRHRHHRHTSSSSSSSHPQTYADLSQRDIQLLIPVFLVSPSSSDDTRSIISALPSHLRAKSSFLSPFCSLHKRLNSLPIIDMLNVVRHEVSRGKLGSYDIVGHDDHEGIRILQDLNAIWMGAGEFEEVYGRAPPPQVVCSSSSSSSGGKMNKCAACQLTLVGRDVSALIALGGALIANIDPKYWRRSKRIIWMEEWVRGAAPSSSSPGRDGKDAVREMWDCAARMRGLPKLADERGHVDEYAARAQCADLGIGVPVRPEREEGQEGHVEFVADELQGGDGTCYDGFGMNPFAGEDEDGEDEDSMLLRSRRRVASSIYSRPRTEVCRDSVLLEEQIIELYFDRGLERRPKGFF